MFLAGAIRRPHRVAFVEDGGALSPAAEDSRTAEDMKEYPPPTWLIIRKLVARLDGPR